MSECHPRLPNASQTFDPNRHPWLRIRNLTRLSQIPPCSRILPTVVEYLWAVLGVKVYPLDTLGVEMPYVHVKRLPGV